MTCAYDMTLGNLWTIAFASSLIMWCMLPSAAADPPIGNVGPEICDGDISPSGCMGAGCPLDPQCVIDEWWKPIKECLLHARPSC